MRRTGFPSLPALVMSAKRKVWRMHDHAGEADKAFQKVRAPVLDAADHECGFCGLRSDKYQEVHHLDDDHANNAKENLACTCPLCHQVFHIGLAGMRDGAYIINMPELSQAEINQLCLVMWIVERTDAARFDAQQALLYKSLANRVKTLRALMENRRGNVKIRFCNELEKAGFSKDFTKKVSLDSISPSLLANVLMQLPDDLYARREDLLGGLRLMPRAERFDAQLKFWLEDQGKKLPITAWYKILDDEHFRDIVLASAEKVAQVNNAGETA